MFTIVFLMPEILLDILEVLNIPLLTDVKTLSNQKRQNVDIRGEILSCVRKKTHPVVTENIFME